MKNVHVLGLILLMLGSLMQAAEQPEQGASSSTERYFEFLDTERYFALLRATNQSKSAMEAYAALSGQLGRIWYTQGPQAVINELLHNPDVARSLKRSKTMSPLIFAVRFGDPKLIKGLLEQKPGLINVPDSYGNTPLLTVFLLWLSLNVDLEERKDIAHYLIKHGADVNIKNIEGDSPLNLAVRNNVGFSLIKDLVGKGAIVDEEIVRPARWQADFSRRNKEQPIKIRKTEKIAQLLEARLREQHEQRTKKELMALGGLTTSRAAKESPGSYLPHDLFQEIAEKALGRPLRKEELAVPTQSSRETQKRAQAQQQYDSIKIELQLLGETINTRVLRPEDCDRIARRLNKLRRRIDALPPVLKQKLLSRIESILAAKNL